MTKLVSYFLSVNDNLFSFSVFRVLFAPRRFALLYEQLEVILDHLETSVCILPCTCQRAPRAALLVRKFEHFTMAFSVLVLA